MYNIRKIKNIFLFQFLFFSFIKDDAKAAKEFLKKKKIPITLVNQLKRS
jgi:hypothetical protein